MNLARHAAVASFAALIALGLAWELWLAPLRPGGSLLALKVVPLVFAMPALVAGRRRAYQAWSMGVLAYVCEGVVRATSDRGPSVPLAWAETALSLAAFVAVIVYARASGTARPT